MKHLNRRAGLSVLAAGITLAAGVGTIAGVTQTRASAAVHPNTSNTVAVHAGKSGVAGWQGSATYDVPTGEGSLFIHYPCPTKRIALDGGFTVNGDSTAVLLNNSARSDITPLYGEWGWTFQFPGGAPAGTVLALNVYCQ